MNAFSFQHVTKDLDRFTLRDLTFSIPGGTICGLMGENGAGKTTAIRLLLGALRPDSGTVSLLGTDTGAPDFPRVRAQAGVVLDEACFPERLFPGQIGAILARTYPTWDAGAFNQYLTRFDLPLDARFGTLSLGMKKKLALAAALSHHARVLVLDEAAAGLDPVFRDELLDLLRDFVQDEDHAVLLSSHILSDLEKVCDYLALLHDGRLLFCQETDRLLETYALFIGTAEQADSLRPEAVVGREDRRCGGSRCLVRRELVPPALARDLERPTAEDVVLFTAKGENRI